MPSPDDSLLVDLTIENNIAYVRFNRENKHNALNITMFNQIKTTINVLKNNRHIRAVIVSGNGDDFCTGLDVKSVMKSATAPVKLLFKWHPWRSNLAQIVSTGWQQIPVPVIMVIEGRCWGGGLQIALGGDFRIAAPDASIAIMEARWGLIPDMGGTLALRRLIRQDIAKELAMTGEIINGDKALEIGLVSHVVEQPMKKAIEMAKILCQQSPDSVAATKKLYNNSWIGSSGFALARESFYQLKILLGKNSKIKAYNQTHEKHQAKEFVDRKIW
ncbi:MAG: crotonase/enoyl-CoA hydratase family protein [Colwellia sp.]|nr:crotonase/enoyl-CoA hydratase family protein [Colwellia sp.]